MTKPDAACYERMNVRVKNAEKKVMSARVRDDVETENRTRKIMNACNYG